MQQLAMSWLVYRLTDSVLLLGAVNFAAQMPSFLLGPVAGVISDRFSRHKVLLVTQALSMLQAGTLAALVLTDHVTIPAIMVLSALLGVINAFDISARQSFVVEMVENREDMSNAIALNSSMFNGARLVGPFIAGIVIAAVGEGLCFLFNAISYLAVIASLLAMRLKPFVRPTVEHRVWESLREGVSYAFGFPPIRALLLVIAMLSLFGMPFSVLMPVFARDVLGGTANTLGLIMGASGVGALTGAMYLASRKTVVGLGKIIVGAAFLFGLGLVLFSFARNLPLAMFCIFLAGLGMMLQMASCNTVLQTIVDEDKRGRVMSFYSMAFMGMAPFGSILASWVAEHVGVTYTLLGCGILCALSIIPFAIQLPVLQRMVRPIYRRLGILPEIATGLRAASVLTTPPRQD